MELSDRIKQRMEEKHWALADLTKETKIAKGYLWEILDGRTKRPGATILYEIARALGTSVADLLGKEETARPITTENIPSSLRDFANDQSLPEEDIKILAAISFRGSQPKTKEDWEFLYQSIKRSTRG